jgi:hypothetical protein
MENQDNLGVDPGQQAPLVVRPEDLDDADQPEAVAEQPAPITVKPEELDHEAGTAPFVVTEDDLDPEPGVIRAQRRTATSLRGPAPVYSWTDAYTNSLADDFEQVKSSGTPTARTDAQEIARELQRRGYKVQGLGPDEWPAIQAVLPQVQSQNDAGQVAVQRPTTARMEPWELTDAKRLADLFETAKRRGDFTAMKSLGQYLKDRYNYEYDLGADGWPYIKSPAGDIIPVSAREPSQGTQQFIENQIAQAQQERAAREFQAHDTRGAPRRFLESAGRDTAGAIFAAEAGLGRLAEDEIAKFQSKPSGPGFYAAPTNIGTYFRARGEQKGQEIQQQQAVESQDLASQAGAFIGRAARTVGAGAIGGPGGVAALDSLEQYGRGATPGQALKTGLESYLGMELGGKLGAEFAARLANPFAKTLGGAIGAGRAASLGEYVGRAGGYAAGPQTVQTITSGLTTGQADVPDSPGKVALDLVQALGFALIGGKVKAEDAATIRGIANSPEVDPDAAQALRDIAAGSGFKGSEEVRVGSPAGPQGKLRSAGATEEQLQPPPPPTADPIASRIAEVDRELETVDPNSERAGRLLDTRQTLARQRGAGPDSAVGPQGSGAQPLRTQPLDPDSMLGQARALHAARLQERASKISDELRYLRDVEGAGPDDPDVEELEHDRLGIAQAGEWTHQILNNLEHNPEWEQLPLITKRVILGLEDSDDAQGQKSVAGARRVADRETPESPNLRNSDRGIIPNEDVFDYETRPDAGDDAQQLAREAISDLQQVAVNRSVRAFTAGGLRSGPRARVGVPSRVQESAREGAADGGGTLASDTTGDPEEILARGTSETIPQRDAGDQVESNAGSGVRRLGLGITEPLAREGRIELRGQQINGPDDVAKLAQVYRDPRYETFRVIYTRGNEVAGQTAVTSRLPGHVVAFSTDAEGNTDVGRAMYEIKNRMQRLGADGYYLLHNHPTGIPRASPADLALTRTLELRVPGFRGHVIINSGKYGFIGPSGGEGGAAASGTATSRVLDLPGATDGADRLLTPSIPHPLLGRRFTGADDVARAAKELQRPGYVTLFFLTSDFRVRAIDQAPVGLFVRQKEFTDFLRGEQRSIGGDRALAYSDEPLLWSSGTRYVKDGALYDYVEGTGISAARGRSPNQPQQRPRGFRVEGQQVPPY